MSDPQSVILNPCDSCGEPTEGVRCETCRHTVKALASIRVGRKASRTWRAPVQPVEPGSHLRGCPPEREA